MSEYHLNIIRKLREEDYLKIKEFLDMVEYDDFLVINPNLEESFTDMERFLREMESYGFYTKQTKNKKSGKECILAARK